MSRNKIIIGTTVAILFTGLAVTDGLPLEAGAVTAVVLEVMAALEAAARAVVLVVVAWQGAVVPTWAGVSAAAEPTWAGVSAATLVAALDQSARKAASTAPPWLAGTARPSVVPVTLVITGWLTANRTITVNAFTIVTMIISGTASCSRRTKTTAMPAITATLGLTSVATTTAALCPTKDGPLTTSDVSAVEVELLLAAGPIPCRPAVSLAV